MVDSHIRPLKIKEITHDRKQIEQYWIGGARLWGSQIKVPLEYYERQGRVYGCFDAEGEMVGGYVLVENGPLRCYQFLPDHIRKGGPVIGNITEDQLIEISGVWFYSRSRNQFASWGIWRHLVKSVIEFGKPYVIFGFNGAHGSTPFSGLGGLARRPGRAKRAPSSR